MLIMVEKDSRGGIDHAIMIMQKLIANNWKIC